MFLRQPVDGLAKDGSVNSAVVIPGFKVRCKSNAMPLASIAEAQPVLNEVKYS